MTTYGRLLFAAVLLGAAPVFASLTPPECLPQGAPALLTTDPSLHLYARMEEVSGTRLDSSAFHNDLSPVGNPGNSTDHEEGAFSLSLLSSGSQYLQRDSSGLDPTFPGNAGGANSQLTLAGWVKATSSSHNHPLIVKVVPPQRSYTLWLWDFGNGLQFDPNIFDALGNDYNGRGVADFHGNTVVQVGQWYHVAYVYDGTTGTSRLYVNGTLDAGPFNENMTTYFTGSAPLQIGYRTDFGADSYADVRLDEVVVLDRALSDSEVSSLYQNGVVDQSSLSDCDDGNVCTVDQCNGANNTCQHLPANAGATCRAAAGVCDVAETCTGTSPTCPADGFQPSSTVCRDAAGECDLAENCSGSSATCPADTKKSSGTACTSDGNPCTLDQCDGSSVTCQHPAGNAGATCRAAAGVCDVVETCTGTSTTCPADAFQPSSTVCRDAAGECDLAENCSGSSATCPADTKKSSGTACTSDGNPCTLDQCDGSSVSCQHPAGNAGATCRAAAGDCDVVETCTGTSTTCPADAKSMAVCRPAVGSCDAADACDGAHDTCPADAKVTNGTPCNSGDGCPADTCQNGVCQSVGCPSVDAVVFPQSPLRVTISPTKTEVDKTVAVTVRNADTTTDRTIGLAVDASDCPIGVVDAPDFGAGQSSILVPAGKTKPAKLHVAIRSSDFPSFNLKAPTRCRLVVTASAQVDGGSNDPNPSNNTALIELNVVDGNDPQQTTTHETWVKSTKPATINIAKGAQSVTKVLRVTVGNADYKPKAEVPGDQITLSADTSCTGLTLSPPVCDRIANSDTVTVRGGWTKICKLTATVDPTQVSTPNELSPQRCAVTLTAIGPSSPDPDPSNNSTEQVIDIVGKNDQ